ncbi:ABC transporter permease [Streptomyces sp. NPDC020403]|uniref:ABC transporter permease n=1 Tax=unclassified Streptomyces TaxID=2593676 RepID=UPI0033ED8979
MNAPSTPPHQPEPHDSWQAPPSGSHAVPATEDAADAPDLRAELVQGAVITAVLAASGVLLGLLWLWLAPRVPLISDDTAVFLKNSEGEEAIGADGTFVLLALAFGLVSAAAVFFFRRRGGIPLVVGLALGGLLGSLLAWGIGTWFGPTSDVVAHAKEVGKGVTFDAPLKLHAVGAAVLAWPVAAMIVHLGLTGLFGPRDPEPEWGAPYGDDGAVGEAFGPAPDGGPGPGTGPGAGGDGPERG